MRKALQTLRQQRSLELDARRRDLATIEREAASTRMQIRSIERTVTEERNRLQNDVLSLGMFGPWSATMERRRDNLNQRLDKIAGRLASAHAAVLAAWREVEKLDTAIAEEKEAERREAGRREAAALDEAATSRHVRRPAA